jgi:hypothetical protein
MKPVARRNGLVVRDLADEVVVYDKERHEAHCLNGTAATVFRNADGRRSVSDLALLVLLERLGEAAATDAFATFDELYAQESGASPLVEVVERLGSADPSDRAEVDLTTYKGLVAPWNEWSHLSERGRHWAKTLARGRLAGGGR